MKHDPLPRAATPLPFFITVPSPPPNLAPSFTPKRHHTLPPRSEGLPVHDSPPPTPSRVSEQPGGVRDPNQLDFWDVCSYPQSAATHSEGRTQGTHSGRKPGSLPLHPSPPRHPPSRTREVWGCFCPAPITCPHPSRAFSEKQDSTEVKPECISSSLPTRGTTGKPLNLSPQLSHL